MLGTRRKQLILPAHGTQKPLPGTPLQDGHPINGNCVAAYLLGEDIPNGGKAIDSSIFRRDLPLTNFTGTPTTWSHNGGKSTLFDGTNDYLDVGTTTTFLTSGRPFAVSWWEKVTSDAATFPSRFLLKVAGTSSYWLCFRCNASASAFYDYLAFGPSPTSFCIQVPTIATPAAAAGKWYHYIITGNDPLNNGTTLGSGTYSFYINGVSTALNSGGGTFSAVTGNRIGYDAVDNGANCAFENVRIWSGRRLTDTEAIKLYTNPYIGYAGVPTIPYDFAANIIPPPVLQPFNPIYVVKPGNGGGGSGPPGKVKGGQSSNPRDVDFYGALSPIENSLSPTVQQMWWNKIHFSIVAITALAGRASAQVKAGFGPFTGTAILRGKAKAQVSAKAKSSGVVSIAGRVKAQVSLSLGERALIALAAIAKVQASARAGIAASAALAGRVKSQSSLKVPMTRAALLRAIGKIATYARLRTSGVVSILARAKIMAWLRSPIQYPIYFPLFTLMRATPVATAGAMSATSVPAVGAMATQLPLFTLLRSTAVAVSGVLSVAPVVDEGPFL